MELALTILVWVIVAAVAIPLAVWCIAVLATVLLAVKEGTPKVQRFRTPPRVKPADIARYRRPRP